MKIYKLDIDTSKPIRKVVQMQQNSTGALSVDVKNDGWTIRNLSCALYDGDTELSAYATTDVGAGYKIDVGDETKVVKFTAKSTPTESINQYIASQTPTGRMTKNVGLVKLIIPAGEYKQDEFLPILKNIDAADGFAKTWYVHLTQLSAVNFKYVSFIPWNSNRPIWFLNDEGTALNQDEMIIATSDISVFYNLVARFHKSQNEIVISADNIPAVGYWTDYSLDTVIRPSENAHCYAEQEVADPTPDPEEPVEP